MTTEDLVKYVKKQGIDFDDFNDNNPNVKTYSRNIPYLIDFNVTYAFEYNERKNYFRFCILGIRKNQLSCTVEEIQKRFPDLRYEGRSWLRVYFGEPYHKEYLSRSEADVKKDVDRAIDEMKSFMNNTEQDFFTFLENNRKMD